MKKWYAIRLQAGATRRTNDGETTAIEKNMVDAGIGCYLPKMRKDIIHHRTKQLITRSFPLMVGYAFVCFDDRPNFYALSKVREVHSVLGINGSPKQIATHDIERIMQAQGDMQFDDTQEAKIKRKEIGRTARLTAKMRYPKGSAVNITSGPLSGFSAQVKSVTGRDTIKVISEILGGLVEVELPIDFLERVA